MLFINPSTSPPPTPSFPPPPQPWEVIKRSHTKVRLACGAGCEAELRLKPVAQLEVTLDGQPALVWNGGKQFIFEHLREKQVGAAGGGRSVHRPSKTRRKGMAARGASRAGALQHSKARRGRVASTPVGASSHRRCEALRRRSLAGQASARLCLTLCLF